jgi:hypothetical protein
MGSTDLLLLDVPMARRAHRVDVSLGDIAKIPSKSAAIARCVQLSGLQDKQIYGPLALDKAHWTRIKQGSANFPPDSESPLMRLCGNHVPLLWSAYHEGFELRPILSAVEAENLILKAKLEDKDRHIATLEGLLKGVRS